MGTGKPELNIAMNKTVMIPLRESVASLISGVIVLAVLFVSKLFIDIPKLLIQKGEKLLPTNENKARAGQIMALSSFALLASYLVPYLLHKESSVYWPLFAVVLSVGLVMAFEKYIEFPPSLKELKNRSQNNIIENWFAKKIRRPIDTVWVRSYLGLLVLGVPAFIGLVIWHELGVVVIIIYGIAFAASFDVINSFEHTNGHNRFFRNTRAKGIDLYVLRVCEFVSTYLLCVIYSRIPNWYEVQHIVIHHSENNGLEDTQTSLPYDRSSFLEYSLAANKFALSGLFALDIIIYLINHKKTKALKKLLLGMLFFYAVVIFVGYFSVTSAFAILVFRYVGQVITTLGYFHEHGMIDISDPGNIYTNSLNYISDNDHSSLGDDAHIEHHLHQGWHWSRYYDAAVDNLPNYEKEKALGFLDGPGALSRYYRHLWEGNFVKLTEMYVLYGNEHCEKMEMAEVLFERTRPNVRKNLSSTAVFVDRKLGALAGILLPSWQENNP